MNAVGPPYMAAAGFWKVLLKRTMNQSAESIENRRAKPPPTGEVAQCAHWGGEGMKQRTVYSNIPSQSAPPRGGLDAPSADGGAASIEASPSKKDAENGRKPTIPLTPPGICNRIHIVQTLRQGTVPRSPASERGRPVKVLRRHGGKALWSGGPEMGRRQPAVIGSECVSARHEFRWNHGHFVRPEPILTRFWAFFILAALTSLSFGALRPFCAGTAL